MGCEACFNTGFKGRALIAEIIYLDSPVRKAILGKADLGEIEQILEDKGHTTMLQDGVRLVEQGVTTREELEKVCRISLEV